MRSISPMNKARLGVVVGAIGMPYAVRIFGGWNWMDQYLGAGWQGFMFLQAFHAVAWVAVLLISLLYKKLSTLWYPVVIGLGLLGLGHATLDLAADAQSALALVFMPIYSLVPIAVGGLLGCAIERRRKPDIING